MEHQLSIIFKINFTDCVQDLTITDFREQKFPKKNTRTVFSHCQVLGLIDEES